MTTPIIATKLHIPRPAQAPVQRPHLIARLEGGARGKLILISAPAGFGKTTLLAEWAAHNTRGHLISWLHLDEGDDQPARFLNYVIAALQTHHPHLGEGALAGLQALPPAPMEAVLSGLINELAALDQAQLLILDDYHTIDQTMIHSAVEFLIDHLPAPVTLVLATRADPPLPLHRWRARGQMTEIRAADLRFSADETRQFLERLLDEPLSARDIAALDRRIEGWAAGLQMAALSLQGRPDVHAFIASFSGSHRYIMDYLLEEIFNRQPDDIQRFLLQTSILERLCGPLCDAVLSTGAGQPEKQETRTPGQQVLEHLERANLFLMPLDEERQWYRYHRLFAAVLRQRLRRTRPVVIPALLQRASAWCAAEGLVEEALAYALAGDDFQAAAQLVEDHALALLKEGALATLLEWLNRLPEEVVSGRPWLNIYYSWALLLTGNFEPLGRYLAAAERRQVPEENRPDLRGHLAAIRAYLSALQGEVDQGFRLADEALALLPAENLTVRGVVVFVLGGIHYMRRDFPAAVEAMREASRIGELAGNLHLAVSALSSAGDLLLNQGKLAEAQQTFQHALALGTGRSGRPLPIAAGVYAGLAGLHLQRDELTTARQFAETALELARRWGNVDSLAGGYLTQAQVAHRQGQASEATEALGEARRLAATHNLSPGLAERIAAAQALIVDGRPVQPTPGFLMEPLTPRELEVLKLMTAGRSNAEIASELIIALGTVKAHTSSIYRKLDTRGRTEAVLRARELGLV